MIFFFDEEGVKEIEADHGGVSVDASICKEGFFYFPPTGRVQSSIDFDGLVVVVDHDKLHDRIFNPDLTDQLEQSRGNDLKINAIDPIPIGPNDPFKRFDALQSKHLPKAHLGLNIRKVSSGRIVRDSPDQSNRHYG